MRNLKNRANVRKEMTMVFGKLMFRRAQSSKRGSSLIRDDTIIGRSRMNKDKRMRD